jgi:amino acid adenylation domain-containing protein/non-ribosomal peptide synthase protein (TIGR01720 family)
LEELNGPGGEYPHRETIHGLFTVQAERIPNNTALIGHQEPFGQMQLSYKELNGKSNQLALLLKHKGVQSGTIVGIMIEPSIEMIIGILGILKSGGAYLPIDPEYPEGRINYMLKDSEAKVLVTIGLLAEEGEKVRRWEGEKIFLEPDYWPGRGEVSSPTLHQDVALVSAFTPTATTLTLTSTCQVSPANLAYIIYTSGTTGKPKGTLVEHRNVVQLMLHRTHPFDFKNTDTWTMFHSYCFDFSVWEMYGALLYGGKLILITKMTAKDPAKFLQVLKKECITVLNQTPTAFYNLVNEELALPDTDETRELHLRYVIFGGEALMPVKLKEWKSTYPKTRLVNMFGITETTVHVTYKEIGHEEIHGNLSNIGKPIPTLRAFVMDTGLNLLPPGIPGELCVGGAGVARGYLNRVPLTAEKFIKNPYQRSETLYRSGDMVKLLENYEMQYLGRIDLQVKIRGHRIEVGEIESHLLQGNGIKEVRVIARENETGDKYLCAYIVPGYQSTASSTAAQWRDYLAKSLPSYMIPSYFVKVEKLPLTSNGKLDRKSLPDPVKAGLESGIEYAAPRNEIERKLVETWASVLAREHIGIHDNFFMIGGDSIKSIQIASRMNEAGYKVQMEDIFQYQTPAELAPLVRKVERVPQQNPVTGIVPLTPIQKAFFQNQKIDHHHFNQAVILYRETGFTEEAVKTAFKKLLQHHDALRMTFKQENGQILQENHGIDYPLSWEEYDLTNQANARDILLQKANQIQASIDLQTGPLMKLGLFHLDDGDRLLISIHHLVIDGVSWRILLEDLDTLLHQYPNKEKLLLPLKSDSFKSWAEKLSAYAHGEKLLKEKIYWEQLELKTVPAIKADFPGETNSVRDAVSLSFTLNEEETGRLLTKVNEPFGTEINDILLTALGLAVNRMYGHHKLLIALEGHGREPIPEDANINRTIGWFTTIFPAILDISSPHDLSQQIKTIKETLHQMPHKGIGYGILNHLTPHRLVGKLEFKLQPQVSFNYLGQFDTDLRQKSFTISGDSTGNTRSLRGQREYTLDITGMISANHLEMAVAYSKKQFKATTIETLLHHYKNELQGVITHCCRQKDKDFTPSDLTYKEISLENLEQLKKQYPILEDVYPLSPMQEGMFFHALADRSSSAYFEQLSYRLMGNLNIQYVKKTLNDLSKHHEILRTAFVSLKSERLLQVVLKERKIEFHYQDISDRQDKEGCLVEFKKRDRQRYFDLGKDALMRVAVFRLKNGEYEFIWSHHHILMDGWCISILISEFSHFYHRYLEKRDSKLPPVKQYRTYIKWLQSQDKHLSKNYWEKYLDHYEEAAGVPKMIDHNPGEIPYIRERVLLALEKEKTTALNLLAAKNHVTLNTVIQTAWAILLGKYNRKEDVVFGAVVSGRPPEIPGMEFMVGLFINTIPVRINYTEDTPFNNLLQAVQKGNLNSEPHHYYPLAEIQSQCSLKHNLLDHILIFENYPIAKAIHGITTENNKKSTLKLSNPDAFEQTNYDLNLVIQPAERLSIKFDYNANVYNRDFIKKVSHHLNHVLQQILIKEKLTGKIEEITLLSPEEREQVLYEFNNTQVNYPTGKTIHRLFQEQVERWPDLLAVAFRNKQLTYGELNAKTNRLAKALRKKGMRPDSTALLILERSIEMIVGILGTLKAGGAYLPMDPGCPGERLRYILKDSCSVFLLTQKKFKEGLKNICECVDLENTRWYSGDNRNLVDINTPDSAAYVIYTSGTTGKPKGVMVEHKSVNNLIYGLNERIYRYYDENRKVCMISPYFFDASIKQVFGALLTGGHCLHIVPDETRIDGGRLYRFYQKYNIDISDGTPTHIRLLSEINEKNQGFLNVKHFIIGGESLKKEIIERFINIFNTSIPRISNVYGPTECCDVSSSFTVTKETPTMAGDIFIGTPMPNYHIYILNSKNKLQPVGVAGELCISGVGLARGYLNHPELTAQKFQIHNNRRHDMSDRSKKSYIIYKTGDLGRWFQDGNIEFLGRIDHQVKIRGFRIEPGEIESRLLQYEGIKDVVVLAATDETGNRYLCAYVITEKEFKTPVLRDYLAAQLPYYMIPSYFLKIDKIPLTGNGKIDREALPAPGGNRPQLGTAYKAPDTHLEKLVSNTWKEILNLDRVGVEDNFFDLGGNSLKIITVVNRLKEALKRDIPVVTLFRYPTVRLLAEYLGREKTGSQQEDHSADRKKGKERFNIRRNLKSLQ